MSARFFDTDGEPVVTDVERRAIGMTLTQLQRAPRRLLLAHGSGKVPALRAALRAGMATAFCTDIGTARGLLQHTERQRP